MTPSVFLAKLIVMKIAIVGAGFTGLAAASDFAHAGHEVSVFEAAPHPGGLAAGFKESGWDWSLEHHYHHIFAGDQAILDWIDELGLGDEVFFKRVLSSMHYDGQQFAFDSPLSLLKAPGLSPESKFWTAATLAYLKFSNNWQDLEKQTAAKYIKDNMGEEAWEMLWQPLFNGKFGEHAEEINAAWFWARIHVRSSKLGYFRGGFGQITDKVVSRLKEIAVEFHFSTAVQRIEPSGNQILVHTEPKSAVKDNAFDQGLVTLPSSRLVSLVPKLPSSYTKPLLDLQGIGAMTLILELDKPFFADGTYWLNINESDWPFLAVVEQTNLVDSQVYGGKHLIYVGKYLSPDSKQFRLNTQEVLQLYDPFLKKLNSKYAQHINRSWLFKAPFAQPLPFKNYSKKIPKFVTPINNLYWCSMQHVYPYDRGTNYAVEYGRRVAKQMMEAREEK